MCLVKRMEFYKILLLFVFNCTSEEYATQSVHMELKTKWNPELLPLLLG